MLIATACSAPPEGQACWTLELLADEIVTPDRTRHRQSRDRWTAARGKQTQAMATENVVCVPKVDSEYVARMEDILDWHAEPYDPRHPVV